jgi:mannan endo-1,4-beta-mannosidase
MIRTLRPLLFSLFLLAGCINGNTVSGTDSGVDAPIIAGHGGSHPTGGFMGSGGFNVGGSSPIGGNTGSGGMAGHMSHPHGGNNGGIAGTNGLGGFMGAAGMSGIAGSTGSGGHPVITGNATRPAYNTGVGFFVLNGKLYDANGVEFRVRGINKLHWDLQAPGIWNTNANTIRWVIDFTQPTSTNIALMQDTISHKMVPMPGNWDGTNSGDPADLTKIVDTWVAQAAAWKPLEKYMIVNIANEWGVATGNYGGASPNDTSWRDSYITAVARMRAAGYLGTLSITSGGSGQMITNLTSQAQAIFNSDPQKNVIFDQHAYGLWQDYQPPGPLQGGVWAQDPTESPGWLEIDLPSGLAALAATGLVINVCEFGPGMNIGPTPTLMTPKRLITEAEANGIGWMAWAWDDGIQYGNDFFALVLNANGNYNMTSDLTTYGQTVVEDPTVGLKVLAKPATIF